MGYCRYASESTGTNITRGGTYAVLILDGCLILLEVARCGRIQGCSLAWLHAVISHVCDYQQISTLYQFIGGSYVYGIMDGEVLDVIDGTVMREESVCLI
jgi:hypothetical protein